MGEGRRPRVPPFLRKWWPLLLWLALAALIGFFGPARI
jgi:hypothetical protein